MQMKINGNIEENIKRCKKLTESQNSNWLGLTNQQAIAHLIARVEELEDENRVQRHQIMNVYDNGYIPKQKIKDKIEELKKEYKVELEENSTKAFILKCKISALEEVSEEDKQ